MNEDTEHPESPFLSAESDEAAAPPDLAAQVLERIEAGLDQAELAEEIDALHAADVADLLEDLDEERIPAVVDLLDLEELADVLHELRDDQKEKLVAEIPDRRLAAILGEMEPDEAAETLERVDETRARTVLQHIDDEEHVHDIRELRDFAPETAGRIMTQEYLGVGTDRTAGEALDRARELADEAESLHVALVVDEKERLVGYVPMQDILAAAPETPVRTLMDRGVFCIHAERDQEVAAHMMEKYDLVALPVVGDGGRLLGVITFDDVMAILEDEAEEDMYRLAGIGADDPHAEGVVSRANKRLPWLATTLVGGILLAVIIARFQPTLRAVVALVSFFPVLMGIAGNVGIQSSTITVRGLATGEVAVGDAVRLLRRETAIGGIIGLVCAVVVAAAAHGLLWVDPARAEGVQSLFLFTATLAGACFAAVVTATLIGTLTPLACHRVGIDPAVAAGPFVTIVVDITAQVIYLTVATAVLMP